MDEDSNALAEEVSGDNEDVENGGVGPGDAEEQGNSTAEQGIADKDDPYGVKKRLGMQAKKHQREMRTMHQQFQDELTKIRTQIGGDSANPHTSTYQPDSYPTPGQPSSPGMTEEGRIQMAVRMALGAKDHEERQAKEAQSHAHVQKQYKRLNDEFDGASEKYEDFDDVVRADDAPFTPQVRDALLLVKNPAEVAYRLGKNRTELERISKLHPIDQVREVYNLSMSLMGGQGEKPNVTKSNPLGSVKANPAYSSSSVTGKTPPSVIRARMKAGTWK